MITLGIDIGTTNISASVSDTEKKKTLKAFTVPNDSTCNSSRPWEHIQNPAVILEACNKLLAEITESFPQIKAIGITGQMHGILYTDACGRAVSPLYTWRDKRCDLPYASNLSWADYLSAETDYPAASGLGLATHVWNVRNSNCPENACKITTIGGYLAMQLCGRRTPLMHCSEAASLSFFSAEKGHFDEAALEKLGIDPSILPEVTAQNCIAGRWNGIPVSVSIGDNQASFLGSMEQAPANSVLLNLGTGGQISICSEAFFPFAEDVECRPYIDGKYLLVGSSLCGGKAYAILERFLEECCQLSGNPVNGSLFPFMNALCDCDYRDYPDFKPFFSGKRFHPEVSAQITGLTERNFTPKGIVNGLVHGMIEELYEYYRHIRSLLPGQADCVVCSGNAIGRNQNLLSVISETFGISSRMSCVEEEAAYGAAIFAAKCIEL